MKNDRQSFAAALYREMPPCLHQWRKEEDLRQDIDDILEIEFDRCENRDFAEGFAAACPFPGCEPKDYFQRVIEVGAEQKILAGIRVHYSLKFSFVDIIAAAEPLDDVAVMEQALDAVREAYACFEVQTVRVLSSLDRELALPADVEATLDQVFAVGLVEELAAGPEAPTTEDVRLEPVDNVGEAAALVVAAYDEYFSEHPKFKTIIDPADEESLLQCRKTGALVYILVAGKRAGLLASCEELGQVAHGQIVSEEVLLSEFRGRGIAAIAQRRLVDLLAKEKPGSLLSGTIDARNLASRATARRVGRKEVAAWYWLRQKR